MVMVAGLVGVVVGCAGAPTFSSKPGRATRWTQTSQFMRMSPSKDSR